MEQSKIYLKDTRNDVYLFMQLKNALRWIHTGIMPLAIIICLTGIFPKSGYSQNQQAPQIRGIYGNLATFTENGLQLNNWGVNAIFVRGHSITQEGLKQARDQNVKIYMEFPVLNGKSYVKEHPEAWAINQKGEKVEAADWFMGVCPTNPGFKLHRRKELRQMLQNYQVDGVWMDYLHWHAQFETPNPILPETCFCDDCLSNFQADAGIAIPEGATAEKAEWILNNHEKSWRDWRCQITARWVADFEMIIQQEQPNALLGIYHCPWDNKAHNGARRDILGLDFQMLKPHVDVFSPMVYHAMMGRDPQWIRQNLDWFTKHLAINPDDEIKIWPIVQASDKPRTIPPEELESILRNAASGARTGVMMFTGKSVRENPEKTETVKRLYREWEN